MSFYKKVELHEIASETARSIVFDLDDRGLFKGVDDKLKNEIEGDIKVTIREKFSEYVLG